VQAEKGKNAVTAQRVAKEEAQAERVRNERAATPAPTEEVRFEVEKYPDVDIGNISRNRVITQEEHDAHLAPAAITRQQRKEQTVTQEFAYSMINLPIAITYLAFATAPM